MRVGPSCIDTSAAPSGSSPPPTGMRTGRGVQATSCQPARSSIAVTAAASPSENGPGVVGRHGGRRSPRAASSSSGQRSGSSNSVRRAAIGPHGDAQPAALDGELGEVGGRRRPGRRRTSRRSGRSRRRTVASGCHVATSAVTHSIGGAVGRAGRSPASIISAGDVGADDDPVGRHELGGPTRRRSGAAADVEHPLAGPQPGGREQLVGHRGQLALDGVGHLDPARRPARPSSPRTPSRPWRAPTVGAPRDRRPAARPPGRRR